MASLLAQFERVEPPKLPRMIIIPRPHGHDPQVWARVPNKMGWVTVCPHAGCRQDVYAWATSRRPSHVRCSRGHWVQAP